MAVAADATMSPEPEPAEYVRVCDAYGAGFFYIPGTETCLQLSGYVWHQIGASDYDRSDLEEGEPNGRQLPSSIFGIRGGGWLQSVRARVNFDARSETEWGALRSYVRLQADWNGVGDGSVGVDQAFIELGGFKLGYSESFWVDSGNGGPSNYGSHSWSGMDYGYQQRALVGYRFETNGFFGAISLEDSAQVIEEEGYMPDLVAKIGYQDSWGAVWAKIGYDEDRTTFLTLSDPSQIGDDGYGVQVGAQFDVPNMPGSSLRVIGYYADSDNRFSTGSPFGAYFDTIYKTFLLPTVDVAHGAAEWSMLVSYNHQFSETFGVSIAGQYFHNFYFPGSDIGYDEYGFDVDGWSAELSMVWFPVSQFEVRSELRYDAMSSESYDLDATLSGFVRLTRYF